MSAGAVGGLLGGAISAGASHAASNLAWSRQKKVLKHQIRWRVKDLRAAGLNPILAASPGTGGSAPSVAMAQVPDFAAAASNAAKAFADVKTKKVERDLKSQQALQSAAQIELMGTQARGIEAKSALDREITRTNRTQQGMNISSTLQNETNAKNIAANTKTTVFGHDKNRSEADMYRSPITRALLQAQQTSPYGRDPIGATITGAAGLGTAAVTSAQDYYKQFKKYWDSRKSTTSKRGKPRGRAHGLR